MSEPPGNKPLSIRLASSRFVIPGAPRRSAADLAPTLIISRAAGLQLSTLAWQADTTFGGVYCSRSFGPKAPVL